MIKRTLSLVAALMIALSANVYSQGMRINRGPYLQTGTPTSIVIKWKTSSASDSRVRYGTEPGNLSSVTDMSGSRTLHEVQLKGLKPGTRYYYSVGSSSTVLQGGAENYFVTSPAAGVDKRTRIWVIGDAGSGKLEQNQVRDAYYKYTGNTHTDVWLWLGDNAYESGTEAEYDANVFVNHYEKIFKQTVAWPAAGNHDLLSANATSQTGPYYELFTLPKNGEAGGVPSGTEAYYSFDYGNVHFVCLESTTASFRAKEGSMISWLRRDLAANTKKWTVVYFHHPPYTKGSHDSDHEVELVEMRRNVVPVLEQYQVDLVLSGHSHSYERSFMLKGHLGKESEFGASMKALPGDGASEPYNKTDQTGGTVYAVAGNSGKLSGTSYGWPHNAMAYSTNTIAGSMVIDVSGDTLEARFLDNNVLNPTVRDRFVIVKSERIPTSVSSSGNSPEKISIYPNPARDKVNLQVTGVTGGDAKVEILNSIGQLVYSKELVVENRKISEEISLSQLSAGMYIVSLRLGERVENNKILITK
jgi:acid phosphatase type 7